MYPSENSLCVNVLVHALLLLRGDGRLTVLLGLLIFS